VAGLSARFTRFTYLAAVFDGHPFKHCLGTVSVFKVSLARTSWFQPLDFGVQGRASVVQSAIRDSSVGVTVGSNLANLPVWDTTAGVWFALCISTCVRGRLMS
jgi:hypothetical protein